MSSYGDNSGVSKEKASITHLGRKIIFVSAIAVVVVTVTFFALKKPRHSSQWAHASQSRISLSPCIITSRPVERLCGTFDVYENRSTGTGRKIALNIIVLPALSATPDPDPVFYLEGGPGGAATDLAGADFLDGLRTHHDLVFVDQRGTGRSNPLDCDDIAEDPANLDAFFGKIFPPDLIRTCREKLEKIANLELYTTPIAMDDLDDVRGALGYDKIDIVATSYGTIAAQIYMRQHPDHVRAAYLAGVATPGFKQPLPFARAAQNALDLLFEDCAADQVCHNSFPNLKEEFAAVIARFDHGPLQVNMIDPTTKQMRAIKLERENYVEHLRLLLYSTGAASIVPYVVHQAFQNDFVPFETLAIQFNLGPSLARGMYFTVTCSEGTPFISEQDIVDETRGTFLGDRRVRAHIAACKEWPRGNVPDHFTDPLTSDLPILMVSGMADGASPPWFAEDAVKLLPNGRQIKVRYAGHNLRGACIWGIMQKFIETASVRVPDASCADGIRRPPFATEIPRSLALQ
jgi:pimeloyl-ACP methyl ester carboxylesterase